LGSDQRIHANITQQMKRILFILSAVISIQAVVSQVTSGPGKPHVDQRVELLSIVFRLAGNSEYNSQRFKLYTDRIDHHFSAFKSHELIKFIQKLRKKNGVSFDAVMEMAIQIDDPPAFAPLVPFSKELPDERWGKANAVRFIGLLQKFYTNAGCAAFFRENEGLYSEACRRFSVVYDALDVSWYTKFYGKEPNEEFIIVNGLGNGGGNYGPSLQCSDGKRKVYAIMGTWTTDSLGMATFAVKDYFPTLLHEFNHSFVNYLVDLYKNDLESSGEKLFMAVKPEMNRQAYIDWETMFKESLVRAAVIKYMKDHRFDPRDIDREKAMQLKKGFLWIAELTEELENYDKQRGKYPTLESYMPAIVTAFKTYAGEIQTLLKAARPEE
jgi:hypothetical protein